MILLTGGTGRLGGELVRLLSGLSIPIRVLTRDSARADRLQGDLVEVAVGDVRDATAVQRAATGVTAVISAVHGFSGTGDCNPRTVDCEGNRNLIAAALAQGVEHMVLVSVQGAAPNHPMELFRMKYRAEVELKTSGLAWTVIRPTAYMETWLDQIGEPLLSTGKTRIFGRGTNPINFVSVGDVAQYIVRAVLDPAMRHRVLELGGPENLTMCQLVDTFQTVSGQTGSVGRVPLPLMRLMAVLLRPVNASIARQIQAGVVMDTHDMRFDRSQAASHFPSIPETPLADVIRRRYLGGAHLAPAGVQDHHAADGPVQPAPSPAGAEGDA